MTGPLCGLPHYRYPDTLCTEPADHYVPDRDPHAGPLIIGGRECGGAAWDEPKEQQVTELTPLNFAAQAGYLRDVFNILAAKAPVAIPTAEELADGAAADKATAQRIHAARPGIPAHTAFNTLQALRAVRALDRRPNPDRADRIRLDDLNSDGLDELYDDLDRYAEVVGELNEAVTSQARDLAALREVARGYCPHCGRGDASPTAQHWEEQKQRADHAEAAIERVRRLHQPTGVVAAAEFGNPPDCTTCGPNTWPCPTIRAVDEDTPAPAAPEGPRRAGGRDLRIPGPTPLLAETIRQMDSDPHGLKGGMIVKSYRDHGQEKWVFRCWGTPTCDGWLSLDHHSQQSAERARDRHALEHHTESAATDSPKEPTP